MRRAWAAMVMAATQDSTFEWKDFGTQVTAPRVRQSQISTPIDKIKHIAPGHGLFDRLEQGDYNPTLVELHRCDEHQARHLDAKLSSSGHFHSVGFNIGFVVNAAISEMLAQNQFPAIARAVALTYLPPPVPDILTASPSAALRGDWDRTNPLRRSTK